MASMLVLGTKGYGFESRYSEMKKLLKLQIKTQNSKSYYWNPGNIKNMEGLNDYQYIKCKWLFELFTTSYSTLNTNYGFTLNNVKERKENKGLEILAPQISSGTLKHYSNRQRIKKDNLIRPLYNYNTVFGGTSNLYNSVLKKA